jgi:hypothetical protein
MFNTCINQITLKRSTSSILDILSNPPILWILKIYPFFHGNNEMVLYQK